MFFVISKILKVFILPLTWILGLLILCYFVKNKRTRKRLFITAIVLLVVFSNGPLLSWAQYMTTRKYTEQQLPKKHYEVAIIMGGFSKGRMETSSMQPYYYNNRGTRMWEAVRLYEAGKVERIMITGDPSSSIDKDGNTSADAFRSYLQDFGIHEADLILEQHARNTRENATLSIAILDSLGYSADQCLIITSATHLKRSLACFATEGWMMDGYATNIYPKPYIRLKSFVPRWQALTDWHELLNEWVGNIVYKVVGY